MAIIHCDFFEYPLTAPLSTTSADLYLSVEATSAIRAAIAFAPGVDDWELAEQVIRIPLLIESGSTREIVEALYAHAGEQSVWIVRGASPQSFPAGAICRSAPLALYGAVGHERVRPAVTGTYAYGVPGETVVLNPTDTVVEVRMPSNNGPLGVNPLFFGDHLPGRVIIRSNFVARQVYMTTFGGGSSAPIWSAPSPISIPADKKWCLIEHRKLPDPFAAFGIAVSYF